MAVIVFPTPPTPVICEIEKTFMFLARWYGFYCNTF